jgi:riboflavin-specific deaminase-like protein
MSSTTGRPRFRQWVPDSSGLSADQVVPDLAAAGRARNDRPHVAINMVATADGKAAIAGRAGPLSSAADWELFHALRRRVDAVMVGAGTLRAERYGRLVRDPEHRAERRRRGLAADPVAVVLTRRLDLPNDLPLLQDPGSRVVVVGAPEGTLPESAATVDYVREDDLGLALSALRRRYGICSILCEGGPHVNAMLLAQGLVDELFLTVASKLAGGRDALTIVAGLALAKPAELALVSLYEADSYLFARYRVLERTPS